MKIKTLSSILGFSLTVASVLTLTSGASAFSLVHQDGSFNDPSKQVVGINDLSFAVDGAEKSFDVEFLVGSFNNVFGNTGDVSVLEGDTPTFWNQEDNARNATLAIINALGNEAFTSMTGNDFESRLDAFFVPFEVNSPSTSEVRTFFDNAQTSQDTISSGLILNLNSSLVFPFAKFQESSSPVTTPVPESSSTLAIFFLTGSAILATRKCR